MEEYARKTARASALEEERERERGGSDGFMNDGREGEKKVGERKTNIATHTETENSWKRQSKTKEKDMKKKVTIIHLYGYLSSPLSLSVHTYK